VNEIRLSRHEREFIEAWPGSAVERPNGSSIAYGEGAAAPRRAALTEPGHIVATPSDIENLRVLRRTIREVIALEALAR